MIYDGRFHPSDTPKTCTILETEVNLPCHMQSLTGFPKRGSENTHTGESENENRRRATNCPLFVSKELWATWNVLPSLQARIEIWQIRNKFAILGMHAQYEDLVMHPHYHCRILFFLPYRHEKSKMLDSTWSWRATGLLSSDRAQKIPF